MVAVHNYELALVWTGNQGTGTSAYRAYGRSHEVTAPGRPALLGSADPAFRGETDRWNPELLLVAALSGCHLMSYLHVCVEAGVVVTAYSDAPTGAMTQTPGGGGRFTEVVLHPRVTVARGGNVDLATRLHADASERCFIASSVNFPVRHEPVVVVES
ncbi:OsmC family protein [Cryptosporangium phraense]|uniref:OsmC family peroxiredoxin n=1 Tax=Cryptosporangium phraense TaxID=2593070 RepID=A0A545AHB4_9ACTN|nr:OsmC family protein [Cryptosporangium phraense]TQS40075.1 OsmC family peroxiredoxin [Cryptosporangium phraense]